MKCVARTVPACRDSPAANSSFYAKLNMSRCGEVRCLVSPRKTQPSQITTTTTPNAAATSAIGTAVPTTIYQPEHSP